MDKSKKDFELTMDVIKATLESLRKWLQGLGDSLLMRSQYAPYRELAKYISKNGGSVYEVQGPCSSEVKIELMKRGIPFIQDANDSKRFILKHEDFETTKEINRQLLIAKCNYFQEIPSDELEDAIAKIDVIKDKEIFSLHNLNQYQVQSLKSELNKVAQGFMVGIKENENGTYEISIPSSKIINTNPKEMDLCKAFLASTFALYGLNAVSKIQRIDNDSEIKKEINNIKGTNKSFYIVGEDNLHYIELNSQGFEFYERNKVASGKFEETEIFRYDINKTDFDAELQRYLNKLGNKTIFNSTEDLVNYFKNAPVKSAEMFEEEHIAAVESLVIDKIDSMIKTKMTSEEIPFENTNEKFDYYQKEASDILGVVLSDNEVSQKYNTEDINRIRNIFKEKNINKSEYAVVKKSLISFESECHKAKEMEKVTDKKDVER